MISISAILVFAMQTTSSNADVLPDLYLACEGGTTEQVLTGSSTVSAADSQGGSASATGVTTEAQFIAGTVLFKMSAGVAEVNVPRQFLSGQKLGNAGWFKVKRLAASEDQITGKLQTNFLVTSTFRIDRRTGIMTTGGGFSGNCTPVDITKKKF